MFVCDICVTCRVLPTPRKNLTESQTAELIRVAALPPERRLAAYKAVLQKMVSSWQLFRQWGVDISTSLMQVTTNDSQMLATLCNALLYMPFMAATVCSADQTILAGQQ
jgi:hypothetical protein